ncbi:MAG TPA: methyltransferase domain-containing protein [Tepidiformaceae bacterium]|nr:methyltransferase domain-containing protein [Tepidiformaceae bacterium]
MATSEAPGRSSQALVERIFSSSVATMDIFGIYLGERLGLYEALRCGPATPIALARRAGINGRYAREWLEQQAATGILDFDGCQFALPGEHAAVLADRQHADYFAPIARMLVAAAGQLPALTGVFRDGGGLSWEAYGRDMVEGQSELNRPFFLHRLGREVLPAIPAVHSRLTSPGARVAEVGFGGGWASIAIAAAYPEVTIDGFDPDALSVQLATANAEEAGLAHRITFHEADGARATAYGTDYDLVCAFECIHDMADPVAVLRSMRELGGAGGVVLVMDERVPDHFSGEGDEVERFMYGWSVSTCLPNGLAESPSVGTGTVLRQPVLEAYARDAGFREVEALDIENDFFRFSLLK